MNQETELLQAREDLSEARDLLSKASAALAYGGRSRRIDVANRIDGWLDVIRCSSCGARIQHAGFLRADGTCGIDGCDEKADSPAANRGALEQEERDRRREEAPAKGSERITR
jgi:hypothetical protein